jgi:uncharacterized protein (TIGR02421 family)
MTIQPTNILYTKVCNDVYFIDQQLDYTKFLTPTNLQEENDTFLAAVRNGKTYNPIYSYEPYDVDFESLKVLIQNNRRSLADGPFDRILGRLLSEYDHIIEMYNARENATAFTAASKKAFGFPSEMLVKEAYAILSAPKNVDSELTSNTSFPAEDLADRINQELKKYGYVWTISINQNQTTKVSIDPTKRMIHINGRKRYSTNDLGRLVVHEVGTHVVRSENGRLQPYKCFVSGLANSLATEEGLAVYAEHKNGLLERDTLLLYAGRVVAAHLTETNSFWDIYNVLQNFLGEEQALYVTQRVKKGLRETQCPGGFVKDYVYLYGYFAISKFMHTATTLAPLYIGSIGLDDLDDISLMIQDGALNAEDIIIPEFMKIANV